MDNEKQYSVINHFLKPDSYRALVVESPPGTGKTYTSIVAAATYIKNKIINYNRKNKVLILTFSRNARAQLQKQVNELDIANEIKNHLEISNYHAFFQKYIWSYSKRLKLGGDLKVLSESQKKLMFKNKLASYPEIDVYNQKHWKWIDSLLEFIGQNNPFEDDVQDIIKHTEVIMKTIFELNSDGYLSFGDFAYYMNKLIDNSPELLKKLNEKYKLVILDEYQDSSDIQDDIVNKIIGDRGKVIFFADSKQMIYKWRGGNINRITSIKSKYGIQESIIFDKVYRFSEDNELGKYLLHLRDNINADYDETEILYKITIRNKYYNNYKANGKMLYDMSQTVGSEAEKDLNKYKSVAYLFRRNKDLLFFKKHNYTGFMAREINNYENEQELLIHYSKVNEFVENENFNSEFYQSFFQIVIRLLYGEKIEKIKLNEIHLITHKVFNRKKKPIYIALKDIIENLKSNKNVDDSILMLYKAYNIDKKEYKINPSSKIFLDRLIKVKDKDFDKLQSFFMQYQYLQSQKTPEGLYMMTYHQCKGREFDVVYMIGCDAFKDNEEDENLFYVGATRAKKKLVLCYWAKED